MVTCIILFVVGAGLATWCTLNRTDNTFVIFIAAMLVNASWLLPLLIGTSQPTTIQIVEEYRICNYQDTQVYIKDGEIIKTSQIKNIEVSNDSKYHVILIKETAPKSIWYFYSLGTTLTLYIPLECK